MSRVFLTPGPSQLHAQMSDFLHDAMAQDVASISHRSKAFEELFRTASDGLRRLLGIPETHSIFFLGTATESWERIIQNTVRESSFHFVNGAFSERFRAISQELGRSPQACSAALGDGIDLTNVTIPPETELLCVTHNETSTGVSIPESMIHALATQHRDRLLAVDAVSSAPIAALNCRLIDALFFSVQKCFGLPAGLGVLVVSPRALARAQELNSSGLSTGSYHTFAALHAFAQKNQTPATPNVLGIYLLGRVVAELEAIGIEELRRRISARAQSLYSLLDSHAVLQPLVHEHRYRSQTVIAVHAPGRIKELEAELAAHDFVVGEGYGPLKGECIRIANFPAHTDLQLAALADLLAAFN